MWVKKISDTRFAVCVSIWNVWRCKQYCIFFIGNSCAASISHNCSASSTSRKCGDKTCVGGEIFTLFRCLQSIWSIENRRIRTIEAVADVLQGYRLECGGSAQNNRIRRLVIISDVCLSVIIKWECLSVYFKINELELIKLSGISRKIENRTLFCWHSISRQLPIAKHSLIILYCGLNRENDKVISFLGKWMFEKVFENIYEKFCHLWGGNTLHFYVHEIVNLN